MKNDIFTNHMFKQSGRKHPWFKHTKGKIHPGLNTIGNVGVGGVNSNGQAESVRYAKQFSDFFIIFNLISRLVYEK